MLKALTSQFQCGILSLRWICEMQPHVFRKRRFQHRLLKPYYKQIRPPCQVTGRAGFLCSAGTYAVGDLGDKGGALSSPLQR